MPGQPGVTSKSKCHWPACLVTLCTFTTELDRTGNTWSVTKSCRSNAYDPVRDVEIDPETGLLQWSAAAQERKPELVRRVAEYFERRREDE